jgi:hypothetical protein
VKERQFLERGEAEHCAKTRWHIGARRNSHPRCG